ncbi:MAG: glycosyltransferase, partial [Pedobacter sp.]
MAIGKLWAYWCFSRPNGISVGIIRLLGNHSSNQTFFFMEIIHIVLGKANPDRMNGVNKVVNELAIRQKLVGLSVSLWGITNQLEHNYPDRIYDTKLFLAQKNPFAINKALKQAILALNKDTVCHLHGGFVPAMYAVAKYLRKSNIKFVFTPHGSYNLIAMRKNGFIKAMYYRFFERKLLNNAYKIHVLGESELKGLYTILPDTNAKLIPYGFQLNTEAFKSNSSSHRFIVGYCGRLDVYTKGLAELLEGFKDFFLKSDVTAQLWIIGDGNQKKYLMKLASDLGISNAVVFHGAKFGIEKFELLMRCNLFAAPSRNEGLPTAVLE